MTTTFTKAQQAQIAQLVAATLAQLQRSAASAPTAPKAPKVSKAEAKAEAARKAARDAKQAEGLATVRAIAQAKATKGKVQLTQPEHLNLARALMGVAIPADADRFTLSIGDKGWSFTGRTMQEVPVTPEQATELRSVFDAFVVRKGA